MIRPAFHAGTEGRSMSGLRLIRRGIAETYEHLFAYALATLIWWACALSIVLGPAGTMLLFIQTDPRNGTLRERPPFRESLNLLRANLVRGWRLGIIVLPPLALL